MEIVGIRREVGDVIEWAVGAPGLAGNAADAQRNLERAQAISSSVRSSKGVAAPDEDGLQAFTAETIGWIETTSQGNWGAIPHSAEPLRPWLSRWPGVLVGVPLLAGGLGAVRSAYLYASRHPESQLREVVDATFGFALLLPVLPALLILLGNPYAPGWQDMLKDVFRWMKGLRSGGK